MAHCRAGVMFFWGNWRKGIRWGKQVIYSLSPSINKWMAQCVAASSAVYRPKSSIIETEVKRRALLETKLCDCVEMKRISIGTTQSWLKSHFIYRDVSEESAAKRKGKKHYSEYSYHAKPIWVITHIISPTPDQHEINNTRVLSDWSSGWLTASGTCKTSLGKLITAPISIWAVTVIERLSHPLSVSSRSNVNISHAGHLGASNTLS